MQDDGRAIVAGALGGAAGTLVMSAVMEGARRAGLLGRHPPELITAAALDAADAPREGGTQAALAALAHLGFGVLAGALFGPLDRRLRAPGGPVARGVAYGSLIWAVSYAGWVPALGILPPPGRDRPGRPATMLVAHWVYGAVLGATVAAAPSGPLAPRAA
jgi:hypothetical protein